jgi:hypothetical protein
MGRVGITGGVGVADDVLEWAASIVFRSAGNRRHAVKVMLVAALVSSSAISMATLGRETIKG